MRATGRLGYLLGAVALLASACGDEGADGVDSPPATANELSQHEGEFCPKTMPRASQDSYGFGTSDPAESKPSLSEPDEAWLCTYGSSDVAPPGANGAWLEWVRQGEPRQLDDAELAAFTAALGELEPPTGQQACTDDLGPRYLISYANDDDLTGVVIDDYGCRAIRLTDDPHESVPGDATGGGTVAGILYGPTGLLDDLHARQ